MNEQEAIEIIENTPFMRMHNRTRSESDLYDALNMAIKALEKQIAKRVNQEGNESNIRHRYR